MRFVRLADGSGLSVRHITRIFAREDVVHSTWEVCASVSGPQQPFVVDTLGSRADALRAVDDILEAVESG